MWVIQVIKYCYICIYFQNAASNSYFRQILSCCIFLQNVLTNGLARCIIGSLKERGMEKCAMLFLCVIVVPYRFPLRQYLSLRLQCAFLRTAFFIILPIAHFFPKGYELLYKSYTYTVIGFLSGKPIFYCRNPKLNFS